MDDRFDWNRENTAHVQRHGVEPLEAEEVLLDPRRMGRPAYRVGAEQRRAYIGSTSAGRVLVVIVTRRRGRLRVITAFPARPAERRRYGRRGR
ncbi:MAG: BrnT family toxin [Thermoplasmata archaeon]